MSPSDDLVDWSSTVQSSQVWCPSSICMDGFVRAVWYWLSRNHNHFTRQILSEYSSCSNVPQKFKCSSSEEENMTNFMMMMVQHHKFCRVKSSRCATITIGLFWSSQSFLYSTFKLILLETLHFGMLVACIVFFSKLLHLGECWNLVCFWSCTILFAVLKCNFLFKSLSWFPVFMFLFVLFWTFAHKDCPIQFGFEDTHNGIKISSLPTWSQYCNAE